MSSLKIEINEQFEKALDLLENTNKHLFITGEAGTGKSTLLTHFQRSTKKPLAVVAPTGVAAVNVGGETIHSFFGFKPGIVPLEAAKIARRSKKAAVFKSLETIIIDEISMVRADLLDCIDIFLRTIRGSQFPFGGIQMVMIGDLYQLPPVVTADEEEVLQLSYRSPYFFSSVAFNDIFRNYKDTFDFIALSKIYRQTEKEFIGILNKIRNKTASPIDLVLINKKVGESHHDNRIVLTSTNAQADRINQTKLSELSEEVKKYQGFTDGDFPPSQFPTSIDLSLKKGSRVMLLNNETTGKWINGTLGTITKLKSSTVEVQIDEGGVVNIEPFTWTQQKTVYDETTNSLKKKETGSYTQLPLRLAWAVTIHKAQGKTFEKVHIDMGRQAFAHGQTYVAISRCRTLDGLSLTRPISTRDILLDPMVINFVNYIQRDKDVAVPI